MAGFQTHITVSSTLGAGYAWWIHSQYGIAWPTAAVAGGLCSIAGMLPDLDSDSGVPARETIGFAAAVVPMLLFNRLHHHGISTEQMLIVGAPIYLFIRFVIGSLLKSVTVHRGMFHSIPAMFIAGMITYLLSDSSPTTLRVLKAVATSLGFLSHLVLDEIWSVEVSITGSRLKSSSGTAVKFFGQNASANAMCYGLALLLGYVITQDSPQVAGQLLQRAQIAAPQPSPPPLQPDLFVAPPDTLPAVPPSRPRYQSRIPRYEADRY
ncbi:MAG TPA: metal-dependent hydrolase [Planctomycetaceae bacterium]|nr:metal-dependent hydrolase [Planctomycetaceae bacterium]